MRDMILARDRGPSPRVRGNPVRRDYPDVAEGSIPACAGKPGDDTTGTAIAGVHPRVCGETQGEPVEYAERPGPSPRVRGNPGREHESVRAVGSIPACAGKPWRCGRPAGWRRVHPRVCGETRARPTGARRPSRRPSGPSPRVRGNRRPAAQTRGCPGSIPACAGKPRTLTVFAEDAVGPSPRVRGNPAGGRSASRPAWSIPACAGKPGCAAPRLRSGRVHPRVCGETERERVRERLEPGPSPRVRGNPDPGRTRRRMGGSIPACAGKPQLRQMDARRAGVHPRVCGETTPVCRRPPIGRGPSPRVRGNLRNRSRASASHRSIPACAGKPAHLPRPDGAGRVHPRVCGETVGDEVPLEGVEGPSPRVRGNPVAYARRAAWVGSIPACAGNLFQPDPCPNCGGSIPACAGKPSARGAASAFARVHPRVCGETLATMMLCSGPRGPSPRVRGNLTAVGDAVAVAGSIPACAGKPRSWVMHRRPVGSIPACAGKP